MILFDPSMQTERIAVIGFAIIIIAALSFFILSQENPETGRTYLEDIAENLFGTSTPLTIEEGDCADVHYIAKYEANDTTFMSSYEDSEKMTGGYPLNVYVTENKSLSAPTNYSGYYSGIPSIILDQNSQYLSYIYTPLGVKKGFIEELVGLKEGETITTDVIQAKNAFGVSPKVGDLLQSNLPDYGIDINLSIFEIKYDQPVPVEYESYIDTNKTDIYVLRDESYYVGKVLDYVNNTVAYPCWTNSSVVDEVEDTYIITMLNPSTDVGENFTWSAYMVVNPSYGMIMNTEYPDNVSRIVLLNDSTIIVKHTPQKGDQIKVDTLYQSVPYQSMVYTVQNVTETMINTTYSTDGTLQNTSNYEFNRTTTINRAYTQNITQLLPGALIEGQLFFLRAFDEDFIYGLSDYADQNIYFELNVEKIYKTS